MEISVSSLEISRKEYFSSLTFGLGICRHGTPQRREKWRIWPRHSLPLIWEYLIMQRTGLEQAKLVKEYFSGGILILWMLVLFLKGWLLIFGWCRCLVWFGLCWFLKIFQSANSLWPFHYSLALPPGGRESNWILASSLRLKTWVRNKNGMWARFGIQIFKLLIHCY